MLAVPFNFGKALGKPSDPEFQQTVLDAKKNISQADSNEPEIEIKKDLSKKELPKKEKPKKEKLVKKAKPKTVKKISESILAKVKSLTGKKAN